MNILHSLFESVFPHTCVMCEKQTLCPVDLCSSCAQKLPWIVYGCPVCGRPFSYESTAPCGRCLSEPPPFQKSVVVWEYAPPISQWISAFKFHKKLYFAQLFAELLTVKIKQIYQDNPLPDILIPVPLHITRLAERGYNQALLIAKIVSKKCKIPLDANLCIKTKHTPSQTNLSGKDRYKNLNGSFECKKQPPKRVAILDDVITTETTIRELIDTLLKNGAQEIEVFAIARTNAFTSKK